MKKISASEFLEVRCNFGSRAQAAEILDVSERQVRRWERGETPPPAMAVQLLKLLAGDLGEIDRRWEGWRLRGVTLFAPWSRSEGYDLPWFMFMRGLLAEQRAKQHNAEQEIERLTSEIDRLEREIRLMRDQPEQLDLFAAKRPEPVAHQRTARTIVPTPRRRELAPDAKEKILQAYRKIASWDIGPQGRVTGMIRAEIQAKILAIEEDDVDTMLALGVLAPARDHLYCQPRLKLSRANRTLREGAPCSFTPLAREA